LPLSLEAGSSVSTDRIRIFEGDRRRPERDRRTGSAAARSRAVSVDSPRPDRVCLTLPSGTRTPLCARGPLRAAESVADPSAGKWAIPTGRRGGSGRNEQDCLFPAHCRRAGQRNGSWRREQRSSPFPHVRRQFADAVNPGIASGSGGRERSQGQSFALRALRITMQLHAAAAFAALPRRQGKVHVREGRGHPCAHLAVSCGAS